MTVDKEPTTNQIILIDYLAAEVGHSMCVAMFHQVRGELSNCLSSAHKQIVQKSSTEHKFTCIVTLPLSHSPPGYVLYTRSTSLLNANSSNAGLEVVWAVSEMIFTQTRAMSRRFVMKTYLGFLVTETCIQTAFGMIEQFRPGGGYQYNSFSGPVSGPIEEIAVPKFPPWHHKSYIMTHDFKVRRKPDNVTVEEAASLLYASLTAWSALRVTGDLWLLPAETKKVLVIGGSGGVGTAAIQMLKAWGTEVTTTCSSDAVQLVESLNADHIIDYRRPDFIHELKSHGKFDIILDAAGLLEDDVPQYIGLLKEWSLAKFITLRSPVLRNTDKMGLVPGMLQNAVDLLVPNLASGALSKGSSFRWGFFMPVPPAMDEINSLVQTSKIRPLIQEKFSFSDLPVAYDRVKTGHLRGKVVVNIE
ncbi:hypothetical protein LSTR_LSTR012768 [Laodelphax striatellus]|uniref:Enoyl reductase (ER) domain-containing protein n=1 Tax=Laodelphax striatellus TaxID=195883 RepID=A0A482X4F1_LAOST|nr:hypothetical protein LSTR_LSTR012768 [Laodelphax striatellus]